MGYIREAKPLFNSPFGTPTLLVKLRLSLYIIDIL